MSIPTTNAIQHTLVKILSVLLFGALCRSAIAGMTLHPVQFDRTVFEQQLDKLQKKSVDSITLQLSSIGQDISIELIPASITTAISSEISLHNLPLYMQGTISGDADSWARLTIENNLPTGSIYYYGQLLRLERRSLMESLAQSNNDQYTSEKIDELAATADSKLVMIESQDFDQTTDVLSSFNQFVDSVSHAPVDHGDNIESNNNDVHDDFSENTNIQKRSINTGTQAIGKDSRERVAGTALPGVSRALRVGIAIDSAYDEYHDGRGLAIALGIMNEVDGLYQQQLGVAVILEKIQFYDDPQTDPLKNIVGTVDDMLTRFRQIRLTDQALPNDLTLVHLFTGHRDPRNVLGLGWIATACRNDGYDTSVSTPFPFGSLLAAHEIAHNLGSSHDDSQECLQVNDGSNNKIMWPRITSSSSTDFSVCSIQSMQASIQASCNLDNIDLSLALLANSSGQSAQQPIVIQVSNSDTQRTASLIRTVTSFPQGTILTAASAGCFINGSTLTCNHEPIVAGSTVSATVNAALIEATQEQTVAVIELTSIADINTLNNRATLRLRYHDQANGDSLNVASSEASSGSADGEKPGLSLGALSINLALLLLGCLVLRLTRIDPQNSGQ